MRKVLVVEDSVDAARMLVELCAILGHEARCVFDGASALSAAAELPPEVVFLDLTLPDLDGFEVAQQLRAIPGCERATLVAVTGWSDPQTARRARAAGFAHFLVKPIDPSQIETILAAPPG